MILSISVGMGSHAQGAQNDKFTKSLQYLKNGHVCWLGCVMGIISLCQSKSVANYFYLKNEDREPGSSSNVLLFFKPCCFKLGYYPIYWKLFNTWNFSELYRDFRFSFIISPFYPENLKYFQKLTSCFPSPAMCRVWMRK